MRKDEIVKAARDVEQRLQGLGVRFALVAIENEGTPDFAAHFLGTIHAPELVHIVQQLCDAARDGKIENHGQWRE